MSDLRQLLEAARADAPSAAARAKVWGGVSSAVGEAAAAAGTGAAGSIGAVKMLVLGTLLGGAMTVGIGGAMLIARSAPPAPAGARGAPGDAREARVAPATPATPAPAPAPALARALGPTPMAWVPGHDAPVASDVPVAGRGMAVADPPIAPNTAPGPTAPAAATVEPSPRAHVAHPARGASHDDALAHEASLVAAARAALGRRDPLAALQMVRGLRALPDRQLVPEELAVEAQALRALGLTDDAIEVDTTLRVRFPDSVLER